MSDSHRDSQRQKVYSAENEAFAGFKQRDVSTATKYEQRLRDILRSKWMRDNYPSAPSQLKVEYSDMMNGANANAWRIRTGANSMQEAVLIHELAHVVHSNLRERDKWDHVSHGRQYTDIYQKLVRRFLGAEAYKLLRAGFRKYKVKVGRKRAFIPGAAQRSGLPVHLAAARLKLAETMAAKFVKTRHREFVRDHRVWEMRCVEANKTKDGSGSWCFTTADGVVFSRDDDGKLYNEGEYITLPGLSDVDVHQAYVAWRAGFQNLKWK
jgi:putative metallohydrolase (TIGR04338 family)